ncbi:MAG: FtsX-like permease family protein [Lachnospiraceae bacterium]|nr:FtsX-like permease family protein [Lachnospiraceae bacterium]
MTITKLAWNNNRCNRSRSILVTVSISLTMLLLVIVSSYGYGIVKSEHANAGLYSGSHYGYFRNVDTRKLQNMQLRSEFKGIGVMALAAVTEQEDLLYFADTETLELNNMMEKLADGAYPLEKNEIAARPAFFRKYGLEEPKPGDTVTISRRASLEEPFEEETFVISGVLKEDGAAGGEAGTAFVSQEYYEFLVPKDQRQYNVYFTLDPSVPINSDSKKDVIVDLAKRVGVRENEVEVNTAYLMWALDPGYETLSVCGAVIFCIILFSVMVIYNIFQVGITQKIREYGKIRALGATRRQMRQLIWREGMTLAAAGIPLGLIAGIDIARLSFKWLNHMEGSIRPEGYVDVSPISPLMLAASALICFATVWLALKKPMRTVAALSPVEAIRYQEGSEGKKGKGLRKGRKEVTVYGLTMANLASQKKRTIATIVTMGLSCTLFLVLANLAGNMNAEYDARKTVEHGDFLLTLDFELNDRVYPENNLKTILQDNPLSQELLDQIRLIDGVEDVKIRRILSMEQEHAEAEKENKYEAVAVLSREDFERMQRQGGVLGDFSYDSVTENGEILFGWSYFMEEKGVHEGDLRSMSLEDGRTQKEFKAAVAGSFGNIDDADWAITEDTYESLGFTGEPVFKVWVDCAKGREKEVEKSLRQLLQDKTHVELERYEDALQMAKNSVKLMKVFCYVLSAMIAVISFMNMANTLVVSVITRRHEFGMLQAIGMTNAQLNRSLQGEGLLFTVGTVLVTMLAGVPCGYGLFRYGKANSWFGLNEYHFPAAELTVMVAFLALFQILLSLVLTRNVKKESVIDRIRYQG